MKPKVCRRSERIKMRANFSEIKTNIEKLMKSKASSLKRSIKSTDFYPDWWRKKERSHKWSIPEMVEVTSLILNMS